MVGLKPSTHVRLCGHFKEQKHTFNHGITVAINSSSLVCLASLDGEALKGGHDRVYMEPRIQRECERVVEKVVNWDRGKVVDEGMNRELYLAAAAAAEAPTYTYRNLYQGRYSPRLPVNTAAASVKSKPSRQYRTPPITRRKLGTV